MQVHDRLHQRVVWYLPQKLRVALQRRQFLDLVERGQPARIAALPLQLFLVQAEVVDEPAASDRPTEQDFLFRGRLDPEPIGFVRKHRYFEVAEVVHRPSWTYLLQSGK